MDFLLDQLFKSSLIVIHLRCKIAMDFDFTIERNKTIVVSSIRDWVIVYQLASQFVQGRSLLFLHA